MRCRRKALLRIPHVANRDALAISRAYPTMKSLLMAYLDPELSVSSQGASCIAAVRTTIASLEY